MLAWSSLLWACATKGDAKAKDLAREGLRQMRRDRPLASESQKTLELAYLGWRPTSTSLRRCERCAAALRLAL